MLRISVIIPSYNSSETIVQCLHSITDQDFDDAFEIIVVDSSTDGTEKKISELFPDVKVLHFEEKTIPGKARNIGAEKAEGTILAFTDSDCIVDKKWLKNILMNFRKKHSVVSGSVANALPKSAVSRAEFYIEFREFSLHSPKREMEMLPAGNFAIKKDIFHRVGGFSCIRASEDTFLAHKLSEMGIKVYFDPEIKIKHFNRTKLKPYLKNQFIIGKYAALVRKILPVPGNIFVKVPYAFPVLPLVRTLRTLQFIFQNNAKNIVAQLVDFLIVYPIFLLGSIVWSYGFFKGSRLNENLNLSE